MSYHHASTFEEIWDRLPAKLLVLVMEAQGLSKNVKDKSVLGEVHARVSLGKQKSKTKNQKTQNVNYGSSNFFCWNEFMFFSIGELDKELVLEVLEHKAGLPSLSSDKLIGACVVCNIDKLDKETPVDMVVKLKFNAKRKELAKHDFGSVHLRLYYSCITESPIPTTDVDVFHYSGFKRQIKTGDLVVFNEVGVLPTLTKLMSNSNYSRVGLAVRLPNKWTTKDRLYILEITRNRSAFQDAYREKHEVGVNIFRFWERMHEFQGTEIWWVPLKHPLEDVPRQNMIDWIWDLHNWKVSLGDICKEPLPSVVQFLELFGLGKNIAELYELSSCDMILHALRLGGRRFITPEGRFVFPVNMVHFDSFKDLVKLRTRKKKV